MGEVVTSEVRRQQVEPQVCLPPRTVFSGEDDMEDEREKAVAAAVEVVAVSARRGVVALCASVAHIIRKNFRLQQQVMELEGRLRGLETLAAQPENTSTFSHCQEYSTGSQGPGCSSINSHEYSSATSHCPSTSESLPESPSSQRCGSAPPHYPPGFPRPHQYHGPSPRKESDPEVGPDFLRGHTRASTGNLGRCSPGGMPLFVRRKYSSISLRRVRRSPTLITSFSGRQGRAAGGSQRSSTASLELQQASSSNTSSKSCIVTVAEVYSSPETTTTTTTESDAVKLLAQKLTSVLQEDSVNHKEDTDDLVLCAPYPLAGCECVLCLQFSTFPDVLPYEIVTDEGSLLPHGSTVLVKGRRLGTVVYFGHCRQPSKSSSTPHHLRASLALHQQLPSTPNISHTPQGDPSTCSSPQPPYQHEPLLSAPNSCDAPSEWLLRSVSSPVGVTVVLWPPDEGEVFVPLNDVICQLDDVGMSSNSEEHSSLVEKDIGRLIRDEEDTPSITHRDSMHFDHTLIESQNTPRGMAERGCVTEDSLHPVAGFGTIENRENSCGYPQLKSVSASDCTYENRTGTASRGGETNGAPKTHGLTSHNSTHTTLKRTRTTRINNSLPASPRQTRLREDCEGDLEAQYSDSDKGKLQFGDTWDSGCYMSLGRHSSECSEQFSDLESEYSSTPWASSFEEALDSVWKKHKQWDTHTNSNIFPRRQLTDSFFVDQEVELQDYRTHRKVKDDVIG